jgi:cytochrome c-type biogenesis protein CcmH/NrfG
MQVGKQSQKNLSFSETIINKRYLFSLLSFIFLTVLLYFCLGRPDLLQPQLQQKKLELPHIQSLQAKKDADENAELLSLYKKLKMTLVKRPNDIRGYSLLVKTCLTLNKYSEARLAQEKVLSLKNKSSNLDDYILLLDTYFIAAGGRFSIEASKILNRIKNEYALNENIYFFIALEHIERKEYPSAINVYKKLENKNTLKKEKLFLLKNKLENLGIPLEQKN